MPVPVVLASASPRRKALLEGLGCDVRVLPAGIPETAAAGETPERLVERLASEKARSAAAGLGGGADPVVVLGADTVVVRDGEILGKPSDPGDAARMLRTLAGRDHRVLTGVCVLRTDDGRDAAAVAATVVRFHAYDEALVRWYVSTGEPMDKAGAYGIQGRGALLCASIEGSWSNVVGLPLEILPGLLERIGLDVLSLLASC
jgi:septum formation protein